MSVVIFDFDGTIADSFARVVEIGRELTGKQGKISDTEVERLRGLSAYQVAKALDIHVWQIPWLLYRGRRRLHGEMHKIRPFQGMPAVLQSLATNGHQLYIMSSNSVENIEPFLEEHGLSDLFVKLYGSVGLFAKARILKKILKQNNLNKSQVYYVGDEVRDVLAAKHTGVQAVAVTWGFNNEAALQLRQPDMLIHTPAELAQKL